MTKTSHNKSTQKTTSRIALRRRRIERIMTSLPYLKCKSLKTRKRVIRRLPRTGKRMKRMKKNKLRTMKVSFRVEELLTCKAITTTQASTRLMLRTKKISILITSKTLTDSP